MFKQEKYRRPILKRTGKFIAGNIKTGGLSVTVEIDEFKFDKRKYHRGHRVEGL